MFGNHVESWCIFCLSDGYGGRPSGPVQCRVTSTLRRVTSTTYDCLTAYIKQDNDDYLDFAQDSTAPSQLAHPWKLRAIAAGARLRPMARGKLWRLLAHHQTLQSAEIDVGHPVSCRSKSFGKAPPDCGVPLRALTLMKLGLRRNSRVEHLKSPSSKDSGSLSGTDDVLAQSAVSENDVTGAPAREPLATETPDMSALPWTANRPGILLHPLPSCPCSCTLWKTLQVYTSLTILRRISRTYRMMNFAHFVSKEAASGRTRKSLKKRTGYD